MTRVLSEVQTHHCPAELIERRDVSANLAIFRFRIAERPSFTAGQYATISIAVDGDVVEDPTRLSHRLMSHSSSSLSN